MISAEHRVLRRLYQRRVTVFHKDSSLPLDVEPKYFDTIVVLSLHGLFPRIELLPLVDIFPTGITSPAKQS